MLHWESEEEGQGMPPGGGSVCFMQQHGRRKRHMAFHTFHCLLHLVLGGVNMRRHTMSQHIFGALPQGHTARLSYL